MDKGISTKKYYQRVSKLLIDTSNDNNNNGEDNSNNSLDDNISNDLNELNDRILKATESPKNQVRPA